jgi:hypothetical protein
MKNARAAIEHQLFQIFTLQRLTHNAGTSGGVAHKVEVSILSPNRLL